MTHNSLTVNDGMVVNLVYTMRIEGDEEALSDEPVSVSYLHGEGTLLPGLEETLYGMRVGEEKNVILDPVDAFGDYDEDAFELVPLDEFPEEVKLEPGMAMELHDEETDEVYEAYIAEINDEGVLLDFNHPLAGETLHVHVRVIAMRPATPDELAHGHVHDEHEIHLN